MNEPIVKGGQGRTDDEVEGGAITWVVGSWAFIGLACIVWAIFRWGG